MSQNRVIADTTIHIFLFIGLFVAGIVKGFVDSSFSFLAISMSTFVFYLLTRFFFYYHLIFKKRTKILTICFESNIFDVSILANQVGYKREKVIKLALKDIISECIYRKKVYYISEIAEILNVDRTIIEKKYLKLILELYVSNRKIFDTHVISKDTGISSTKIIETYGRKIVETYYHFASPTSVGEIADATNIPYPQAKSFSSLYSGTFLNNINKMRTGNDKLLESSKKQEHVNILRGMFKLHGTLDINRTAEIMGLEVDPFMKLIYELVGSGEIDLRIEDNLLISTEEK